MTKATLVCRVRTTVDIPEPLMERVKSRLVERQLTFRDLVISALERALQEDAHPPFRLKDASVGRSSEKTVSVEEINRAVDEQRRRSFGS